MVFDFEFSILLMRRTKNEKKEKRERVKWEEWKINK